MGFDKIEIWKTLQRVATLIGLHPDHVPQGAEKILLLEYICECYAEYSPEEIERAFKFALSEKFVANTNCYGDFSCKFFSDIMNSYRRWKKQSDPDENKKQPIAYFESKKEEITDDAMHEWLHGLQQSIAVNQNYSVHFIPTMLQKWMVSKNLISEIDDEFVLEGINLRRQLLFKNSEENPTAQNKFLFDKFVEMQNSKCLDEKETEIVRTLAQKIQLLRWLRNRGARGTLTDGQISGREENRV